MAGIVRRTKTAIVKAAVPKPVRDVLAGAYLHGRANDARSRGWTEVADRMDSKAKSWAMGIRSEPDASGNWNGNTTRRPVGSTAQAIESVERMSRLPENRPGILDWRPFDRQMVTPGYEAPPFHPERLPQGALREVGAGDIPLEKVRTSQPTVSVDVVKSKIAAGAHKPAKVIKYGDQFWVQDGNHGITSDRVKGATTTNARIYELSPGVKPPALSPRAISRGMGAATAAAGPLMIGAASVGAYQSRLAAGGSGAEAVGDAIVAGGKTAATGAVIGSLAKTASAMPALRSVAAAASRVAIPLSIAGHAVGYAGAAWMRGESGYDIAKAAGWGAINGVLPIDAMRDAFSGQQQSNFEKADKAYKTGRSAAVKQPDQSGDMQGRRGWSDQARINSAIARGAQALPYGGQPRTRQHA